MFRILLYSVLLLVVFDVIPHRTSSTPLSRVLRSPSTTPESHISNFLHQHRTDSRADKPDGHPVNATSDPLHHHTTTTSTEAPLTQTELITNILHTVLHSVRERFPGLIDAINAISAPKDPPKSLHHHKRLIKHHLQTIQDRSTNASSVEDSSESDELSLEEDEEEPEDAGPENNAPSLLPSSLIKVILEASGSSAARGSASASAGSVASSSGSSSSSSSGGSGNGNGRSNENESQGSGSGDFLVSKIQYKARALASLVFAPLLGAYTFVQRSLGAASGSSSGSGSIPSGSGAFPEPEYHPNHHHHADGHHHHPDGHHADGHHHNHHEGEDHHPHSSEHDHNHNHHVENVTSADGVTHIVGGDDVKESLHKLAFRNAFYKYTNLMTKGTFNETTADPLLTTNSDGPLHVVLDNGGLDYDADNPTEIDPLLD